MELIDADYQLSKIIFESLPPVMSSFLVLFEVENNGESTTMLQANIPIPENNSSLSIKQNELNGEFIGCSIKWEKPVLLKKNHKITCVFFPNIDRSLDEMQTHVLRCRIENLISKNGSIVVKSSKLEEGKVRMVNASEEQMDVNRKDKIKFAIIVFALINAAITALFLYRRHVSSYS